ncbi:MAG: hypothetical protein RDV48_25590 [Candidatus Eremiobacteraeota bacterium]|nr:hypothetical protein [Candidatus Eremiobacteraeota bacterium]
MMKRVVAALLVLSFMLMTPVIAAAEETGSTKFELEGKIVEALNKIDVDKLVKESSSFFDKYKFSDEDVAQLKETTKSFAGTISDYAKALKAAEPDKKVPAPHDGLKAYCDQLQAFLDKYKVTCEDVLSVGKAAALMAMSNKEGTNKDGGSTPVTAPLAGTAEANTAAADAKIPTQDDMQAAFDRLIAFSKQYQLMAADLVPVIYNLGDIGMTALENRVDFNKAMETQGYWRKKVAALGATKEQSDALFKSIMGLKRKYEIKMSDITKLTDDLSSQLKIAKPDKAAEEEKEPDTDSQK